MLSGNHFPALRGDKKRQNGIDKTGVYGLRKKTKQTAFYCPSLKTAAVCPQI